MSEHLGSVLLIVLAFYVGLQFVCILPVSYVLNVASVSGLSIDDRHFGFL
jgi:hypothetical protein